MPTAADSNGNGAAPAHGAPRPSYPETVVKGGPFELAEIERVANELFRAMPGVVLPGVDARQPESDRLAEPAAAAMPMAEETVNTNGHLNASRGNETRWWYSVPAATTPAQPPPPAAPGMTDPLSSLGGDAISLAELGLTQLSAQRDQDPFAAISYVVREAGRLGTPAAADPPTVPRSPADRSPHPPFDAHAVRREFPVLAERVHGRPLVWLDNGATTQKPEEVIERLGQFYRHENSNVHRGAHELAARATDAYEHARDQAASFLNASSSDEIVFVRGTTEAINLVAQSWGRANVGPGDEVLITWLEHHANIVPWQKLCRLTGAQLRVAPVGDRGQVLLEEYERLLCDRTRIVAISHVSNVLGTIVPVRKMTDLAHRRGARVLVDGAQAVSHLPVDVQALDSDWYAFSGHKVFGPTGIGVLHAPRDVLESMPPWQVGGNMIRDVTFERTQFQPPPARFEAGTPSIADAVGLGAALEYVQRLGMENVARHEGELLDHATSALGSIPGLRLIGTAPEKVAVLSFVLDGFTPEQVAQALDRDGIAVRAGHHCAQPIVRRFGHEGTVRASLALYNTHEDIDALVHTLRTLGARRGDRHPNVLT